LFCSSSSIRSRISQEYKDNVNTSPKEPIVSTKTLPVACVTVRTSPFYNQFPLLVGIELTERILVAFLTPEEIPKKAA
jgi:hypothetical protein